MAFFYRSNSESRCQEVFVINIARKEKQIVEELVEEATFQRPVISIDESRKVRLDEMVLSS